MHHATHFLLKPIPAMLALVVAGTTLDAQAVAITTSLATVSSDFSINGSTPVLLSESSPPATTANIIQSASSGNVSILTHPYVFVPSLVFGNRASGDIFGGTGSYDVNASVVLDLMVGVASGGESFNFTLQQGEVGVVSPSGGLFGPDFLQASLSLLIQDVSGSGPVTLFSSTYDVTANSGGPTVTQTGTSLGTCSSDSCTILGQSYSLNLGSSVTDLRYTLDMSATGNLSNSYTDCGSFGGGSEQEFFGDDVAVNLAFVDGEFGSGGPCGSIARTGDPISVPEPASLALGTLGLAALGLTRRRRKRVD